MGKIQTGDIHPGLHHADQGFHIVRGWPDGGDDFCFVGGELHDKPSARRSLKKKKRLF
jgi:hypothetical protein